MIPLKFSLDDNIFIKMNDEKMEMNERESEKNTHNHNNEVRV